ncbi:MAG: hypothetical protein MZV64_00200 [Ignavibacteriales bacterium]|nr:hypothetical protein [Ignavibacteriales bacterium]
MAGMAAQIMHILTPYSLSSSALSCGRISFLSRKYALVKWSSTLLTRIERRCGRMVTTSQPASPWLSSDGTLYSFQVGHRPSAPRHGR